MSQPEDMEQVRAVVGKLRACGHFLYHRTGGKTGRRRILTILAEYPEILQKDLQERLRIQSGSLSEVVIKLEAEGLIEKVRSQSDGRQWALRLTQEGHREAVRLKKAYDEQISRMMSCFDTDQLAALYSQLDTMLAHWNSLELWPEPGRQEKE